MIVYICSSILVKMSDRVLAWLAPFEYVMLLVILICVLYLVMKQSGYYPTLSKSEGITSGVIGYNVEQEQANLRRGGFSVGGMEPPVFSAAVMRPEDASTYAAGMADESLEGMRSAKVRDAGYARGAHDGMSPRLDDALNGANVAL